MQNKEAEYIIQSNLQFSQQLINKQVDNQLKSIRNMRYKASALYDNQQQNLSQQLYLSQYRQIKVSYYSMTNLLVRENHSYSHTSTVSNLKKIKNYSYSPLDKIGKGFSSIVYRGTNDQNNQTVAIKAIDMKGVKDSVSREMLDCEIQALTKLKHPNILKCYDVIRETSHCFIVTEFCNQGDLSSLLKKKKRLPEAEVLKIMKDIVSGFLQIGQNKFLHRDLKLANIFMSNGVAKIADFGFAKKSHSSFEREKYNVGSPLYMSPQALKKNLYSIKNDIWSVGIMIYEMLHGQTPWECRTETELIQKMTKVPVKFRETLNLSQVVKDFIKKCLEVDQNKRMGLAQLKLWSISNNMCHAFSQQELASKKSPTSQQNSETTQEANLSSKPLGDATNRYSLGVEKARSLSNVVPKLTNELKVTPSNTIKDKQNKHTSFGLNQTRPKLSKLIIDKNNTIILIEINKFRLFYKIYQKIKLIAPEQKLLLNALGTDILNKVQDLADIILDAGSPKSKEKGKDLGLKELDSYLREQMNANIKKYISVIKQYQKKYKNVIAVSPNLSKADSKDLLKKYLSNIDPSKDIDKDESLMLYWIIQAVKLRIDTKKEELDTIIDARNMPSKDIIMQRVKQNS